jgi:ankyrin repeat protein
MTLNEKQPEIVQYLLKKDSNILERNSKKQTSLHLAVLNNSLQLAELFLKKLSTKQKSIEENGQNSVQQQSDNNVKYFEIYDSNGESPLHYACRNNNAKICELLITYDFELNRRSDIENKLPHELCTDNNLKHSLQEQLKVNELNAMLNFDIQLLLEASKSGDLEVVKVTFKKFL